MPQSGIMMVEYPYAHDVWALWLMF